MLELLRFGSEGWGDEILMGAAMTVAVAVCSYALGLVVGFLLSAAKLGSSGLLRRLANGYTTIVRGVPELLVIYLLFFGLSAAITRIAQVFGYGGRIDLNSFVIGVTAVGLISGAYSTEVMRGARQAIPRGQIEAARAVGMRPFLMFRRIVLPQMLRYALPGLGNVWQLTLKDTALISVTALAELMRISSVAARSTREPFLFYLVAAALYLVMTTVSQAAFRQAEARANRGVRRA